nr:MAG TPA: structural protein [Caudoviricetes sp.]
MADIQIKKYPVDLTGKHPDNLVANEMHELSPTHRAIVPREGYFYGLSMIVRLGDRVLVVDKDYRLDDLNPDLTKMTRKAVYKSLVILDESLMGEISLTYQCYGRSDDYSVTFINKMYQEVLNNRHPEWKYVLNKPEKFPPLPHRHRIKEITYWDSVVNELRNMIQVIQYLRTSKDKGIYKFMAEHNQLIEGRLISLENAVQEARNLVGSIQEFRDNSNAELAKLEAKIKAIESLSSLQTYMNEVKADIVAELNRVNTAQNTARETAVNELKGKLNALQTNQGSFVNLERVKQEIEGRIGDLVNQTALNEQLKQYQRKADVVDYATQINQKMDTTTAEAAISAASKTAEFKKVSGLPTIWYHNYNTPTNSTNYNDYIKPGSYTVVANGTPTPNYKSFGLVNNPTEKGVLEVIGDVSGTHIYQKLYIAGLEFMRRGQVSGTIVTFGDTWTANFQAFANPISTNDNTYDLRNIDRPGLYNFTERNKGSFTPLHADGSVDTRLDTYYGTALASIQRYHRTFLLSLNSGHHYFYTNDRFIGETGYNADNNWVTERIITTKVLNDELPGLIALNKKATALTTLLQNAEANGWLNGTSTPSNSSNNGGSSTGNGTTINAEQLTQINNSIASKVNLSDRQANETDFTVGRLPRFWGDGYLSLKSINFRDGVNAKKLTLSNNDLLFDGRFRPKQINLTSDERLKEILGHITPEQLKSVDKLNGVSYRYLTDKDKQYGFIAQEVQAYFPELVHEDENGYLSLDYISLIALLLEKTKDQEKRLSRLERIIEKLEVMNNEHD